MILQFPDHETLQLALINGAIPPAIATTPIRFHRHEQPVIETASSVPRPALSQLRALGVRVRRGVGELESVAAHWYELIALVERPITSFSWSTVRLLSDQPQAVADMSRLLLQLDCRHQQLHPQREVANLPCYILQVDKPPVYALIRALDDDRLTVFAEQSRNVWTAAGFVYPLPDLLNVPADQSLMIQPNQPWWTIDESNWEPLDSHLQVAAIPNHECRQPKEYPEFEVALNLIDSSTSETPTVWIIPPEDREVWEQFLAGASEETLRRLMFTPVEVAGASLIVIRMRSGAIDRPYLPRDLKSYTLQPQTRTIYVPNGKRLAPALNESSLQTALGSTPDEIVWVESEHSGALCATRVSLDRFQPVTHWIRYITAESATALSNWSKSIEFDWPTFEVTADADSPKSRPRSHSRPSPHRTDAGDQGSVNTDVHRESAIADLPPDSLQRTHSEEIDSRSTAVDEVEATVGDRSSQPPTDGDARTTEFSANTSSDHGPDLESDLLQNLIDRLTKYQQRDDAEVVALWHKLAEEISRQGKPSDAATAESLAAWYAGDDRQTAEKWFAKETALQASTDLDFGRHSCLLESREDPIKGLTQGNFSGRLIASTCWYASLFDSAKIDREIVRHIQNEMLRVEQRLPIRISWRGWLGFYRLTAQDRLGLTQARERLLQRIQNQGLHPARDFPATMWQSGPPTRNHKQIPDIVDEFEQRFEAWSCGQRRAADLATPSILRVLFNCARGCHNIDADCDRLLPEGDGSDSPAYHWTFAAYRSRLHECREQSQFPTGPLSDELSAQLEGLSRSDRYQVDRLRQHSRLLAPATVVDPFATMISDAKDALSRELRTAAESHDVERMQERFDSLLVRYKDDTTRKLRISAELLQRAQFLDPQWVAQQLQLAEELVPRCDDPAICCLVDRRRLSAIAAIRQPRLLATVVHQIIERISTIPFWDYDIRTAHSTLVRDAGTICNLFEQGALLADFSEALEAFSRTICDSAVSSKMDDVDRKVALCEWELNARTLGQTTPQSAEFDSLEQEVRRLLQSSDVSTASRTGLAEKYIASLAGFVFEEVQPRLAELLTEGMLRLCDRPSASRVYQIPHLRLAEQFVRLLGSPHTMLSEEFRQWIESEERQVIRQIHDEYNGVINDAVT